MKNIKKYAYIAVASLVFIIIVLAIYRFENNGSKNTLDFYIDNEPYCYDIDIFNSEDGNTYVFLPSYADLGSLKVSVDSNKNVMLGATTLTNGMGCDVFDYETAYPLTIDGHLDTNLYFYKSANVATMYINTVSGSMDTIHIDKNNSEYAAVALYTPQGQMDYLDSLASIKGRGNATWGNDKKPYTLTLSTDSKLLGMNTAKEWILLANWYDETNLNNKLVLDLAKRVGFYWTPSCAYVDLYLNGEYRGLYLLAEKIEVSDSRLQLNGERDFLCKNDLYERFDTLKNPFLTNGKRTVEITFPSSLSNEKKSFIENKCNELERLLSSNVDLTVVDNFDLDSWVRKYLIDEISGNIDADLASSYFYYSSGKFYAGPIWDYDMTLGNSFRNQSPTAFHAQKDDLLTLQSQEVSYYGLLCSNSSFNRRMVEIYEQEFIPVLNEMIAYDISKITQDIQSATLINSIRWKDMYEYNREFAQQKGKPVVCTADGIISYLEKRVEFLSDAWIAENEYCNIHFLMPSLISRYNVSVKKGDVLSGEDIAFLSEISDNMWINKATGNAMDFSEPITTNVVLYIQSDATDATDTTAIATREYISFLSIGMILCIGLVFLIVDLRHKHIGRRRRV